MSYSTACGTRLEPLTVFVVPKRGRGKSDGWMMQRSMRPFWPASRIAVSDTTTLSFLLGLREGLVAKHVNQMLADGRLVRVLQAAHDNRFLVHRAI